MWMTGKPTGRPLEPPSSAPSPRRGGWVALGLGLWGITVTAGMVGLWAYATTPGMAATPPARWPAEVALKLNPRVPTLVMTLHPRCSCSRASVEEPTAVLTRAHGKVAAYVVFVKPNVFSPGWEQTDL